MNTQTLNLIISFIATVILGIIIVPKLRKLKIGQVVRDDGPKSHLKKSGTPTMGGIIMILVIVAILGFYAIKKPIFILPIVAVLGFGVIGFIDDYITDGEYYDTTIYHAKIYSPYSISNEIDKYEDHDECYGALEFRALNKVVNELVKDENNYKRF